MTQHHFWSVILSVPLGQSEKKSVSWKKTRQGAQYIVRKTPQGIEMITPEMLPKNMTTLINQAASSSAQMARAKHVLLQAKQAALSLDSLDFF